MKTNRRTRSITAHVTPEEIKTITERANTIDRSVSEWARDLLLKAVATPQADLNTQLLLAELAAIRGSMLLLLQHVINGTAITDRDLMAIVDDSDQARFKIAASRLREGMKVLAPARRKAATE